MNLHWMFGQIGIEEHKRVDMSLRGRGLRTPLVGTKPFCDLGDDYFKEELKRLIATKRDRLWKNKEELRQYKDY